MIKPTPKKKPTSKPNLSLAPPQTISEVFPESALDLYGKLEIVQTKITETGALISTLTDKVQNRLNQDIAQFRQSRLAEAEAEVHEFTVSRGREVRQKLTATLEPHLEQQRELVSTLNLLSKVLFANIQKLDPDKLDFSGLPVFKQSSDGSDLE